MRDEILQGLPLEVRYLVPPAKDEDMLRKNIEHAFVQHNERMNNRSFNAINQDMAPSAPTASLPSPATDAKLEDDRINSLCQAMEELKTQQSEFMAIQQRSSNRFQSNRPNNRSNYRPNSTRGRFNNGNQPRRFGTDRPNTADRFRNMECFNCHKFGHSYRVCRSQPQRYARFNYTGSTDSDLLIEVKVNGFRVKALLDTGSNLSLVRDDLVRKLKAPIQPDHHRELTFGDGKKMICSGTTDLITKFDRTEIKHTFTMIDRRCPFTLVMGLDWMEHLGIQVCPEKTLTIANFRTPTNRTELRSFLGLANFYKKLIENFAKIAAPLYEITSEKKKFVWTKECERNFNELKQRLCNPPIIKQFDPTKKTFLSTDASIKGVAGLLEQEHNGVRHLVECCSRTLKPCEKNYGICELECLALVYSINHFRHYLLGKRFDCYSDHHSLCFLTKLSNPSGRLARWCISLGDYEFTIHYKKGCLNTAADFLSRYPLDRNRLKNTGCVTKWPDQRFRSNFDLFHVETRSLRLEQQKDEWCLRVIRNIDFEDRYVLEQGVLLKIDSTVNGVQKLICLPEKFVKEILEWSHDTAEAGHLGRNRTLEKVRSRYYWPRLAQDVSNFVFSCSVCQKFRDRDEKIHGELLPIQPQDVFYIIATDIVGPIRMTKKKNRYILTVIDFGTRYAIAIPMKTITSEDILQALFTNVFLKYGFPRKIWSDRGTQFTSNQTRNMLKSLGIEQRTTTAYHQSANGLCERVQKSLVAIIRKFTNEQQTNWDDFVPFAMWAYNTTVQESTGYSPHLLLFGRPAVLTIDHIFHGLREQNAAYLQELAQNINYLRMQARQNLERQQERQRDRHNKHARINYYLKKGDYALVRNNWPASSLSKKLRPKFLGPFEVLRQVSPVNYELQLPNRKDVFHISNLSKFYRRDPQARRLRYLSPVYPCSRSPIAVQAQGKRLNSRKRMAKGHNCDTSMFAVLKTNKKSCCDV